MATIYLAARYSRNPEMRDVRDRLVAAGHHVTSRWIDLHGGELQQSFTPERLSAEPKFCRTFAEVDLEDLAAADVVVSFTGNGGGGKGGRHVEFGLGVALAKRCIIVGPRENVFHCLGCVEVVSDVDGLLELLNQPDCVEQLIADFRGVIPAHCDFCNQPMKSEEAVAEEAGQWACLECWKRFEAEDAALRGRRSEL